MYDAETENRSAVASMQSLIGEVFVDRKIPRGDLDVWRAGARGGAGPGALGLVQDVVVPRTASSNNRTHLSQRVALYVVAPSDAPVSVQVHGAGPRKVIPLRRLPEREVILTAILAATRPIAIVPLCQCGRSALC